MLRRLWQGLAVVVAFIVVIPAIALAATGVPWQTTFTLTNAHPTVLYTSNIQGNSHCSFTVQTGSVYSSATVGFYGSGDNGTTLNTISGTKDAGDPTQTPSPYINSAGTMRVYPTSGLNAVSIVAAGFGSGMSILGQINCN